MTPHAWGGLAVAVASAAALNWGYFVQHAAAASAPSVSLAHPIRSGAALLAARGWLVSNLIVGGGWLLYLAALRLAPLSLVQAASAGGIGVLALLVARVGDVQLRAAERASVGLAFAGLALLGLSLGKRAGIERAADTRSTILWLVAVMVVAGIAAGPVARVLSGGAGLGVAAGLSFASADIATKAALTARHGWWYVPVFLGLYSVGFVTLQLGFQRGGALTTAGLANLFTNALPIVAGIALFHNPVPGGISGAMRLTSFIAVVAAAVLLARPEQHSGSMQSGPIR